MSESIKKGKIDTRLADTGLYYTYEQHLVTDAGVDTPVGRIPVQSHKLIRKGEVLAYIAAEVEHAVDDASEFKGEAEDAEKMLGRLNAAIDEADIENALYWGYFLGRAMERHSARRQEPHAKRGKKTLTSAKAGHVEVYGSAEENAAKWAEWQASLDAHMAEGVPIMVAYKRVANQFCASERTIRRRTKAT